MVNDFPTFMQKYLTCIQNKIFENQILSCWLPSWWRTNEHWESVQNPVTSYSARMYCKDHLTNGLGRISNPTLHLQHCAVFGFLIYGYNYGVIIVVGTWNRSLFFLEESILIPQKCHQSELPATSALLLAAFFLLAI
jgi:hypothetical protein